MLWQTLIHIAFLFSALAIAMADIEGRWDVNRVTAELSRFADACVSGALRFLLRFDARVLLSVVPHGRDALALAGSERIAVS